MPRDKYVYPYSIDEAKRLGELDLWRESHKVNIECKKGIEKAIADNFDGMHLNGDVAKNLCEEFGIDRVHLVLANTVQHALWDGRYRTENKEWAKDTYIPRNKENDRTTDYSVNSHPEIVNGLINQYKRYYQSLGLFNRSHCDPDSSNLDFNNRVLVVNPSLLKDEFKSPENQLFYANVGGFGCSPGSHGKVMGEFLNDGENTSYHRDDFIGVIKDEFLPEWAAEKLEEINAVPEQSDDGMTMK